MRRVGRVLLAVLLIGPAATVAFGQSQTPSTPEKKTAPGTGGRIWYSGPPEAPNNTPPATGGSIGVQWPPDTGPTRARCSRNGKEVPC